MLPPYAGLVALLLSVSQAARIDGTWELARIFRSGATGRTRTVPIDSTVYVRLTLETHPGGWMGGRLYRRYYGQDRKSTRLNSSHGYISYAVFCLKKKKKKKKKRKTTNKSAEHNISCSQCQLCCGPRST